jgi:hypothetical protein
MHDRTIVPSGWYVLYWETPLDDDGDPLPGLEPVAHRVPIVAWDTSNLDAPTPNTPGPPRGTEEFYDKVDAWRSENSLPLVAVVVHHGCLTRAWDLCDDSAVCYPGWGLGGVYHWEHDPEVQAAEPREA